MCTVGGAPFNPGREASLSRIVRACQRRWEEREGDRGGVEPSEKKGLGKEGGKTRQRPPGKIRSKYNTYTYRNGTMKPILLYN